MDGGHGSALDHRRQRSPVLGIQSRQSAGGLAVDQAFRTTAVELHHPVADDLHSDTADPCGLAPRRTLVNRRKRQKPTRLRSILRALRRQAARNRIKIRPQRDRHDEHSPVRHLERMARPVGKGVFVWL